jgi:hypothetical protein
MLFTSFQIICTSPRLSAPCRNMPGFSDEHLARRATHKLEDHPLSAIRDWLFNIFVAAIHIYKSRWPNSRSRPLFGLYQNLFAASERSISSFFGSIFESTYLCEEAFSQMKIIKSRYRSRLTDEHLKYCLHMCLSNYEPSFSKAAR